MNQRDQAVSEQQAAARIQATVERVEHYRYLRAKFGPRQLQTDIILDPEESAQLADLLANPPDPTEALMQAFALHRKGRKR